MFLTKKRSSSFRFPYQYRPTTLGKLPYPVIPVEIIHNGQKFTHEFLIDTGADITTLPQYIAHEIGLNLEELSKGNSQGIGRTLVKTWETKIRIKIKSEEFDIRCSFVSSNAIPPLLGKLDFFDKFNLTFDNKNGKLILNKN